MFSTFFVTLPSVLSLWRNQLARSFVGGSSPPRVDGEMLFFFYFHKCLYRQKKKKILKFLKYFPIFQNDLNFFLWGQGNHPNRPYFVKSVDRHKQGRTGSLAIAGNRSMRRTSLNSKLVVWL